MALNWAEGFEQYGGQVDRMLDGVWSELNYVSLSTENPRTGTSHMRIQAGQNSSGARRVLPVETWKSGLGFAFNINELPTRSDDLGLCQLLSKDNVIIASIMISPTGAVLVKSGGRTGPVIGESSAEVIMPGSYQHFEYSLNETNLEVRINTVTVVNLTDLTLVAPVAQYFVAGCYGYPKTGASNVVIDVDDVFARDGEGATVNSWVGDKKAFTQVTVSDGIHQDWTPSSGSAAWPILDNIPPNDAMTITASDAGDKVNVGMAPLDSEVVSIAGVYVMARVWKTDAGTAKVSIGMMSGSESYDTPDIAVSNRPRWYGRAFDVDPATSALWTIHGLNAATPSLTRTE